MEIKPGTEDYTYPWAISIQSQVFFVSQYDNSRTDKPVELTLHRFSFSPTVPPPLKKVFKKGLKKINKQNSNFLKHSSFLIHFFCIKSLRDNRCLVAPGSN